jgi:hypothetical protein
MCKNNEFSCFPNCASPSDSLTKFAVRFFVNVKIGSIILKVFITKGRKIWDG